MKTKEEAIKRGFVNNPTIQLTKTQTVNLFLESLEDPRTSKRISKVLSAIALDYVDDKFKEGYSKLVVKSVNADKTINCELIPKV